MLALHTTSNGSPEEKLGWAFRMYDVDGNGSIDFNEMKRSVTNSSKYSSNLKLALAHSIPILFRVVSAVYEMMGTESSNLGKARELFSKMDENSDGLVR